MNEARSIRDPVWGKDIVLFKQGGRGVTLPSFSVLERCKQ